MPEATGQRTAPWDGVAPGWWINSVQRHAAVQWVARIAARSRSAASGLWRGLALPLLALALLALLALFLRKVPERRVAAVKYTDPSKQVEDETAARTALAQIVGGGVLLVGLYFTARNLHATEEGKITDRFSKAIELLGSEKVEVRLGGIYALERIARDSERDHWTVMEVLTAYVRENAPSRRTSEATTDQQTKNKRPRTDMQAILTVLGRRVREHERVEQHIELTGTDLTGALLVGADLRGADLAGADLASAHLRGAHLTGAVLRRADLTHAHYLTWEQINVAHNVDQAKLPSYLQIARQAGSTETPDGGTQQEQPDGDS